MSLRMTESRSLRWPRCVHGSYCCCSCRCGSYCSTVHSPHVRGASPQCGCCRRCAQSEHRDRVSDAVRIMQNDNKRMRESRAQYSTAAATPLPYATTQCALLTVFVFAVLHSHCLLASLPRCFCLLLGMLLLSQALWTAQAKSSYVHPLASSHSSNSSSSSSTLNQTTQHTTHLQTCLVLLPCCDAVHSHA